MHGLVALFGALARREVTSTGGYIDLSQTEALLATLAQAEGGSPGRAATPIPRSRRTASTVPSVRTGG